MQKLNFLAVQRAIPGNPHIINTKTREELLILIEIIKSYNPDHSKNITFYAWKSKRFEENSDTKSKKKTKNMASTIKMEEPTYFSRGRTDQAWPNP